jgi:hypothetical protein
MRKISILDCGCVLHRPKESSCKNYGTRWRVYNTDYRIMLKCRDCGRILKFMLKHKLNPQLKEYENREKVCEEIEDAKKI